MRESKQTADKKDLRKLGSVISESEPMLHMRIDRYLGHRYPFLSRTSWQKRCLEGSVYNLDGPIKPTYKLQVGDQLFHHYPKNIEPKVEEGVFCIYRNRAIMAAYKPPLLPMHEGGRYRKNTFYTMACQKWGNHWRAVHRLDRETSGVVVCGGTSTTRAALSLALRQQNTHKTYYAIGIGKPPSYQWRVDRPIGHTTETSWRTKRWVDPQGKPAITDFQVIGLYQNYSLLKITPIHGRTHQIRIHASYSGLPLMGDVRYHHNEDIFLQFLDEGYSKEVLSTIIAPRLCLHAGSMRFQLKGPRRSSPYRQIAIFLPLPNDIQWIWKQLKYPDAKSRISQLSLFRKKLQKSYESRYKISI